MDRAKRLVMILFLFFILIPITNAECDYETQTKLRTQAANVKGNYEAGWYGTGEYIESEVPDENGDYLTEIEEPKITVNIYNLTEDIYISVTNKNTNEVVTYHYADSDNGTIEWTKNSVSSIVEYEIKVYSNHQDCLDTELYKFTIITPMYNDYHNQYYCQGLNEYYCQEFITTEINMTENEIYETASKKQEQLRREETTPTKKNNFWEKYYIYFIVGGILIIGVATAAIIIKRRRSSVL